MEVKDYHVGRSCLGWEGALRIGSMEVMEGKKANEEEKKEEEKKPEESKDDKES